MIAPTSGAWFSSATNTTFGNTVAAQKALGAKGIFSPQTILNSTFVIPPIIKTFVPTPVVPPGQLVPTNVGPNVIPPSSIPTPPPLPAPPTSNVPNPTSTPVVPYSPTPQPDPITPPYSAPTAPTYNNDADLFENDYTSPPRSSYGSHALREENNYNAFNCIRRPQYPPLMPPRPTQHYQAPQPQPAYNARHCDRNNRQNAECNPNYGSFQSFLPLLMNFFSGCNQPPSDAYSPIFNFNFNFGSNIYC